MAAFETTPSAGMIFTACTIVDDGGLPLFDFCPKFEKRDYYETMLFKNLVPSGTVVVRREIIDQIGGYDERIFIPNDWDLWLRIAEVTEVEYLPEPLTFYRRTATSISRDLERQLREQVFVLQKAAQRNSSLGKITVREALASWYYQTGHAFLKSGRQRQALLALLRSLGFCPVHWKTWSLLALILSGAINITSLRERLLR